MKNLHALQCIKFLIYFIFKKTHSNFFNFWILYIWIIINNTIYPSSPTPSNQKMFVFNWTCCDWLLYTYKMGVLFLIKSVSFWNYTNWNDVSPITQKKLKSLSILTHQIIKKLIIFDIKCVIFDTLFQFIYLRLYDTYI